MLVLRVLLRVLLRAPLEGCCKMCMAVIMRFGAWVLVSLVAGGAAAGRSAWVLLQGDAARCLE